MKFYETKSGPGRTAFYSDLEININVHSKVLAAGTKFSNRLHSIWLSVMFIMLLPVGLVWSY